jgi:hypothetical protein
MLGLEMSRLSSYIGRPNLLGVLEIAYCLNSI